VALECVGGVDAAKRVRAGKPLDAVVLSREAIDDLIGAGQPADDVSRRRGVSSTQPDAARALLAFFGSPALRELKQAHGMDTA
jgi:molybdate transport system substrate-binding protein